MRLETRTPSEPQLDNQRVGWIKVLGFVLFRFKSASLKNRTLLCYSDSHLTTQPNLRVIAVVGADVHMLHSCRRLLNTN